MNKIKKLLLLSLLIPNIVFGATAVGWNTPTVGLGWILPNLVNGVDQAVNGVGGFFTSASSTFAGPVRFPGLSDGCLYLASGVLTVNVSNPICTGGGGGAGSGTVGTSTPLVGGQVDFSTSANTIGNDATFLFSTAAKRLTAQNASTTAFSSFYASSTLASFGSLSLPNLLDGTLNVGNGAVYSTGTTSLSVASPLTVTGTLGALIGGTNSTINCQTASGSQAGCLASADWTTFNNKQTAGSYITALTGDVTASGPGSVAATLATVNGNVGSFTNSSITVNGKGLITAASSGSAPEVPLTFTWPLIRSTNTITFGGLSTTSAISAPQVLYATGVNTVASAATTSLAIGSSLSNSGTLGSQIGGSASSLSINTANTNTWSVLQNFNYSSSTIYSSFQTSSSTNAIAGTLTLPNISGTQCLHAISGVVSGTGSDCGSASGLTSYNAWPFLQTATQSGTSTLILLYGNASTTGFSANYASIGGTASSTFDTTGKATFANGYVAQASSTVVGNFRELANGIGKAPSATIREEVLTDGTYTQGVRVEGDVSTRLGYSSFVTGDAQVRFTTQIGGLMGWGSGAAVTDTNLYRSAAGLLATDNSYQVGKYFEVGSTTQSSLFQTTLASSTAPQLALSAGAGLSQWVLANEGGKLYVSTTTTAGTATSSVAALSIDNNGKVIANCFSTDGSTCLSSGGGSGTVSSGLAGQLGYYNASGNTIVGTSTNPLYVTAITATSSAATSTFIGPVSLSGTTSRYRYDGVDVLYASTSSGLLTVGFQAGASLLATTTSTGHGTAISPGNTIIGYQAMTKATSTLFNTAVGYQVMQNQIAGNFLNSDGSDNTGVGYQSQQNETTGGFNTSVGAFSMQSVTTGGDNDAFGYESLGALTTGIANEAFGDSALTNVTKGSYNVGVGLFSGLSLGQTGKTDTGNLFMGALSGELLQSGDGNIILGYNTLTDNLYSGDGNILIGSSLSPTTTAVSGALDIGNVIFGTGMYSSTTTTSNIPTIAGKIGLGTTSPKYLLHLNSTSAPQLALTAGNTDNAWTFRNAGGNLYISTSSPTTFATSTTAAISISPSTGTFLGVATTSPWRTLAVTGTVGFDGLTGSSGLQTGILCLSANKEVINDSVACVASAARFKQNVQPLSVGLTELLKLQPVSFQWKPEYNGALQSDPNFSGTQYSLIADAVQKVDPNLVSVETSSTTFDGVSYPAGTVHGLADMNHWVALIVQSIKDLVSRLTGDEARITKLETQNAKLQTEIDSINAKLK